MSMLGTRVKRIEDPRLLTAGGSYVDDLIAKDALHAVIVRSSVAHARLDGVAVAAAREAPGVVMVVSGADIELAPSMTPEFAPLVPSAMTRPWLAHQVVRFVGEPVAMVVAERRDLAVDAAELVQISLTPLAPVVNPVDAEGSSTLLFPELGTNVFARLGVDSSADLFEGCEVVVRARVNNQRVAACPLEPRAAISAWSGSRLTHWTTTQRPHGVRDRLAQIFGIPIEDVHVIVPDVGGGFGTKLYPAYEEVVVAWAARQLGRTVRWVETRTDNLLGMGHGRAQIQDVEIGGTRAGRITAYRLGILQDAGAYPDVGALLPGYTMLMAPGVYDVERVETSARAVVTNTAPTIAYRGAGRPEATAAIERAIDLYAFETGLDPAAVRRVNAIPPGAFPYTTRTGAQYDSGDYVTALDWALDVAGYGELRVEQAARRARGDTHALGVGMALYTEITNAMGDTQFGAIDIDAQGRVTVRTGTMPTGQGHATTWAMIVADELGVPLESIDVVHGDTALVPFGPGTGASSAVQVAGTAVKEAAAKMIERGREVAADVLEAAAVDIVLDAGAGVFHVVGSPTPSCGWSAVAAADGGRMGVEVSYTPTGPTFPFGANVVVVDVDTETGMVVVGRVVSCDDAGRIINPLLAEGQLHGGIAQGLAQALMEEVVYDDAGNLLTATFADYAAVSAAELPSFELGSTETLTPLNSLGAKGLGESGTIGATPALQNAVVDALAHFGIRHIDLPLTPERVWRAINQAAPAGAGEDRP
jgi:carbon-monoxide dehydrogenase large subunit